MEVSEEWDCTNLAGAHSKALESQPDSSDVVRLQGKTGQDRTRQDKTGQGGIHFLFPLDTK